MSDISFFTVVLHLLVLISAYLLGSISFAVIVSKLMKLPPPTSYGSGNPGATNVLRTGNKTAALLTLVGDAAKGLMAVWLAHDLGPSLGTNTAGSFLALVGLAAFIGHLAPIFHQFKGGKGVATALGVLLGLSPILGFATLGTWLIIAYFFRYSSLAALIAALFAPFYDAVLFGFHLQALFIAVMSALLIWRHRNNIQQLRNGSEKRIGR